MTTTTGLGERRMTTRAAAAIVAGVLALTACGAGAQEPRTVVLDTSGFWREHYSLKPPVVKKGDGIEPIKLQRSAWLNHQTPPPPADWTQVDFNDSAWSRFPGVLRTGNVYDGRSDGVSPFIALLCVRGKFAVVDPAAVKGLTLSLSYRGGVIVRLNGKEIARGNLKAGEVAPDQLAESGADGTLENAAIPADALRKGVNVLTLEVHRGPCDEKDVLLPGRGNKNLRVQRGTCAVTAVRLEAAGDSGLVSNTVRPKGIQVWNSDPLAVDCDMDFGDPNEPLGPVNIVATRNGAFSGKVVVGSTNPIKGLRAEISDLKGAGHIPASAVRIRYAQADGTQEGINARYLARAACFAGLEESPPREVPVQAKAYDARAQNMRSPGVSPVFGAVVPVWVTVNVPADAPAGNYEGTLAIHADGAKVADVPVRLAVSAWMLPEPRDFTTWVDVIQSPESVAMKYGVPLWSDEHFKYLERSLRLLGQVGNKVTYVHLIARTNAGNAETMVRWIKQADGTYRYDVAPLAKYLDTLAACGIRPAVVCLFVWDTYLEGGRGGAEQYAGPAVKEGRAAYEGKGPVVSALDPATGKVENVSLPMYSTPAESLPMWKALMAEVGACLEKRGLRKAIMLGVSTDNQPTKEVVDFWKEVLPGVPWVSQGHAMPESLHGVPVKYLSGVWAGGVFPPDPSVGHTYGWKRTFLGRGSKEFSSPNGGVLVHHPRNMWWSMPVTAYRALGEMNVAGSQRGFARLAADFFGVLKDRRGNLSPIMSRYPETSWRNLDLRSCVLSAGKDGAISTQRFEMLREGIQECEARIFIERAILDKKIAGALAERAQSMLDARIAPMRLGTSTLILASEGGGWTHLAYMDNSWWQNPGVIGYYYYVGSGWQDRSKGLFDLAAEVAEAVK